MNRARLSPPEKSVIRALAGAVIDPGQLTVAETVQRARLAHETLIRTVNRLAEREIVEHDADADTLTLLPAGWAIARDEGFQIPERT